MKNLSLLVWLTQLGFSVAMPLGGFVLLAVWLHDRWGWGDWVVSLGVVLGVIGAVDGLKNALKAMERMAGDNEDKKPTVSFNDHE